MYTCWRVPRRGGLMGKRYFTVKEANRMVPALEGALRGMIQMYTQIRSAYQRLAEAGFAPQEEEFLLDPPGAGPDVVDNLANLKMLMDALRGELARLHKAGCLIKSIEVGLVDWYAKKDGRDIFLCWRLGEKEVRYWHDIEAGYAGRRPISELGEGAL